jgi:hypothetical protein
LSQVIGKITNIKYHLRKKRLFERYIKIENSPRYWGWPLGKCLLSYVSKFTFREINSGMTASQSGQINDTEKLVYYSIKYENIPKNIQTEWSFFRKTNFFKKSKLVFDRSEIKQLSSNKEDLEAYLISKKYNL